MCIYPPFSNGFSGGCHALTEMLVSCEADIEIDVKLCFCSCAAWQGEMGAVEVIVQRK